MKRFFPIALIIGFPSACALAVACGDEPPGDLGAGPDAGAAASESPAPTPLRVLFIGNSYTFVNDVPGILARIAATAGQGPTIATDEVVQAGATLGQLAEAGTAGARIAERRFTHVVLQGHSFEANLTELQPEGRELTPNPFLTAATQLGDQIVDAGARPTWFVTWAHAPGDIGAYSSDGHGYFNPDEMQDRVTEAYDEAFRQRPGSLLSCVGEAFRASLRDHPEIVLHQPDNTHATLAGSYLAACTFYVALTGHPVPAAAEVPAGITADEAATLRQVANVGSDCAAVRRRGIISLLEVRSSLPPLPGAEELPYDYGVAAVRIPARFRVWNAGALAATIVSSTLSGPFEWTSGAFPGGSGTTMGLPFCSSSLAPQSECLVSVSFTGQSSGTGQMTLQLANAYRTSVSRALTGVSDSRDRALLTLSQTTAAGEVSFEENFAGGELAPNQSVHLVVTNRGGAPTTAIGEGQPLTSPFIWGTPAAEGFPGGTGIGSAYSDPSVSLPFCGPVLGPGAQCLVGVGSTTIGDFWGQVSLAYADATGPAAKNATLNLEITPPRPADAGADQ